jgi:hypothetical protein
LATMHKRKHDMIIDNVLAIGKANTHRAAAVGLLVDPGIADTC